MEFVLVPKGKSWLGGSKGNPGVREVEIAHGYYLGKYLVTQEEWQNVMGTNPSHFSRTGEGKDEVKDVPDDELKRFPVDRVSWDDAQLFLTKVNERTNESGWLYRLPKEEEWEYACRGGPLTDPQESAFDLYFDKPTNELLPGQANWNNAHRRTCKVGSYKPNRLGLYDMHGNVWEWCDDRVLDFGAGGQPQRVERGGCWHDDASGPYCRASARITSSPSYVSNDHGLRLARVPDATKVKEQPESISEVRRFRGHTAAICDVAFSPDGRLIASGAFDNTARVWDVGTGKELNKLEGYTAHVECVCFFPDGRRLIAGSADSTLRLWDITSGKEIGRFEGHPKNVQYPLRITPDSNRLISHGEDKSVRVWDVKTRKQLRQFDYRAGLTQSNLWVSSFSADGRRALTAGGDKIVWLWDVDRGRNLGELNRETVGGAFSPDGRLALLGSGTSDRALRLYDLANRKVIRRFDPAPGQVCGNGLLFSPNGQRVLAMYEGGDLGLWEVASGKEIHHFVTRCAGHIVFSPDGRYALCGLDDNTLQLCRLPD
jgi:formylglycine-generating enzyme required for sulfatase activity